MVKEYCCVSPSKVVSQKDEALIHDISFHIMHRWNLHYSIIATGDGIMNLKYTACKIIEVRRALQLKIMHCGTKFIKKLLNLPNSAKPVPQALTFLLIFESLPFLDII